MGKKGADLLHQKKLALRQNIDMHQFCNMRPLSKAACMEIHFYVRNGACCVMQQHHPLAGAKFHKIHKPGCLGVEDDKQELLTQNLSTCQAAHSCYSIKQKYWLVNFQLMLKSCAYVTQF